jgi:RNA polymerase sigma-70 factor (ECF subfamily)
MPSILDTDLPAEAVDRARDGDLDAFEAIYRAFEPGVRTLARRLLARNAAAEDLAQDVFVEVLLKLRQFDGRGSFAGWVRAITVNKCLMHLRSPWRRALRWVDPGAVEGAVELPVATSAGNHDSGVDLERALARLGDTARMVVWLHDVEGYTHAEIGALLGGTPSLSKSQLSRAHLQLREMLEPPGVKTPCMPVSTSC